MTPYRNHLCVVFCALAIAGLTACGGGGGGGSEDAGGSGTLRMALTDAPACGLSAVNITVEKIRVHQSASATDADAGWADIVLNPARRVDLLTLTNGVLMELGQIPLPAGKYTQMRLVLANNSGAAPFANSVVPTGQPEVALKTPSGQQSGIKMNVNIDVAPNKMADFVVDFDACKSVVSAGASGQYLLKPVVSVIPRYVSGVQGVVEPGAATTVSLQINGELVRATTPDSTGKFLLQPVAPGNYTLVIAGVGRTTTVVTGVPVAPETVTPVGSATAPLGIPPSPAATVQGSAPADAQVRVLQSVASAGVVEVAGGGVDAVSGAYRFAVPTLAPRVAAYAASPTGLVFAADTAAAGRYAVQARLAGFADKTQTLPVLNAGDVQTTDFQFP